MSNIKFVVKVLKSCIENRQRLLTIRQISKISKMSYNATYRTIHTLEEEGVVNLMQVGSASVVQLNDNKKTKGFIALAESYSDNEKRK